MGTAVHFEDINIVCAGGADIYAVVDVEAGELSMTRWVSIGLLLAVELL
jgi:hypothetical protein